MIVGNNYNNRLHHTNKEQVQTFLKPYIDICDMRQKRFINFIR